MTDTTSVQVDFYTASSADSSTIVGSTIVDAILIDRRNHLLLNLNLCCNDISKFVSAQVVIDAFPASSYSSLQSFPLRLGQNYIGRDDTVSSTDIKYNFTDGYRYSIKIKVLSKENGTDISTLYSKYTYGSSVSVTSYNYLFREDGGDVFDDGDAKVNDLDKIKNGSSISIKCPLVLARANVDEVEGRDNRVPHSVLFTFDEVDDYNEPHNSDNSEQLSSYSVIKNYIASGDYTLSENDLINDSIYLVNVTGIYSDGHTVSKTLSDKIHVITSPVIHSVTAYGLGQDKLDSGVPTISSIMNVFLTKLTAPVKIQTASNNVRFELRQGETTFYRIDVPVESTAVSGLIKYTIENNDDLETVLTDDPPNQNADGSYDFDVVAIVEYMQMDSEDKITKTSEPFSANFNSDINQLPAFSIHNAWVAAAVTVVGGVRKVTSTAGYQAAPEFGIVGKFSKHDFYGSGIISGLYQDLDEVVDGVATTKHKFMVSINGATAVPVKEIYQMQGYDSKSDQAMYIELLNKAQTDSLTSDDGEYPNIPGTGKGSEQPAIYFWIPKQTTNSFVQQDSVVVSIQILGPNKETTRPDSTSSNEHVVVHKVNKWPAADQMGSDKEPSFSGSGETGVFTVPINNPTSNTGDFYLKSATLKSDLNPTHVTQTQSNGGVFDITVTDPSKRGNDEEVTYQVYYTIDDPNGENGNVDIEGPLSQEYKIKLNDAPTSNNITINNYEYAVYNDDDKSAFSFNVSFNDVDDTSVSGLRAYFESDNIPKKFLREVSRSDGDNQSITVTLQDGDSESEGVYQDGIKIIDEDGEKSDGLWENFEDAVISFVPYLKSGQQTSEANISVDYDIYHAPDLDVVEDVGLIGGVKESYKDTKATWLDNLVELYGSYDVSSNTVVTVVKTDYPKSSSEVIEVAESSNYLTVAPPSNLLPQRGFYYKKSAPGSAKHTWYVPVPTGLKMKDIKNLQLDTRIIGTTPLQNDNEMPMVGFYTAPKLDGKDKGTSTSPPWYRSRVTYSAHELNRNYEGKICFRANVDTSSPNSIICNKEGYTPLNYSLASNSLFATGSSSVSDIGEEDILYIHVSSDSGASTTLEYFVEKLVLQLYDNFVRTYQFVRSDEVPDVPVPVTILDSDSYVLDIGGCGVSTYTVNLQTEITLGDGKKCLSEPVTLEFDSVSVDTSTSDITVLRPSNHEVVKLKYAPFTVFGDSDKLNVTKVEVVDNQIDGNEDPEDASVEVLDCDADVQQENVVNTYDISDYALGDVIDMKVRAEAGVKYTVDGVAKDSVPLWLALAEESKEYRVATKPDVIAPNSYSVSPGGDIEITLNVNLNGLSEEGLQSFIVLLSQEGDYTDDGDNDPNGATAVLNFDSSQNINTYDVQGEASDVLLTDNMAVGESFELTYKGVAYNLTLGALNSSDQSVLRFPSTAGFDIEKPINIFLVGGSRAGTAIDMGEMDPL